MNTPPIAVLEDLCYQAGGKNIVNEVSFTINSSEILTIIGPNGSGKTTLAKLLLKLLPPTSGTVRYRPGITIGYMPQKMHIEAVFPLTVERFLALTMPSRADRHRIAEEIGVTALLPLQMHTLSGGEMQRVLLAQALANAPSLLVLDEPIQGMDIQAQKHFYALIDRLRRERQCAIVMISHDLHMVMQAADRVLCMHHHICCAGKPEDVRVHPEYRQLFYGEDLENIAVYRHHHDHVHTDHCDHKEPNDDHH